MKKTIILLLVCLLNTALICAEQYKMAGPYKVVARDGQYRNTKGGSERDMKKALELAEAGIYKEAMIIIDAYAATLDRLDGHDAPLCAIQCYDLVKAMTIASRNGAANKQQQDRFNDMINRALLPMIKKFDADSPYANGNWGAIVNRLRMACAICMKDSVLYKTSIDYHLHANDNGALPMYISETGQCQETGRDQGHVQLGLEALSQICEMAWEQGDDLPRVHIAG